MPGDGQGRGRGGRSGDDGRGGRSGDDGRGGRHGDDGRGGRHGGNGRDSGQNRPPWEYDDRDSSDRGYASQDYAEQDYGNGAPDQDYAGQEYGGQEYGEQNGGRDYDRGNGNGAGQRNGGRHGRAPQRRRISQSYYAADRDSGARYDSDPGGGARYDSDPGVSERYGGPGGWGTYGHHRPPPGPGPGRRPLTRRVGGGSGRVFLDAVSARSGTLVIGLVLARMMSPREFGTFGVVVVALLGAQSIGQLGAGSALALWRTAPEDIAPTVTTVSLTASAAVYAACYADGARAAPPPWAPRRAAPVIRVVMLSIAVSGLVTAPRAMLQRRAPWLRVMIEQVDNWIGVAVTIGLVATGHGLMSFAVGRIAGSVVAAAAVHRVLAPGDADRPGPRRRPRAAAGGAAVRGVRAARVRDHQRRTRS